MTEKSYTASVQLAKLVKRAMMSDTDLRVAKALNPAAWPEWAGELTPAPTVDLDIVARCEGEIAKAIGGLAFEPPVKLETYEQAERLFGGGFVSRKHWDAKPAPLYRMSDTERPQVVRCYACGKAMPALAFNDSPPRCEACIEQAKRSRIT